MSENIECGRGVWWYLSTLFCDAFCKGYVEIEPYCRNSVYKRYLNDPAWVFECGCKRMPLVWVLIQSRNTSMSMGFIPKPYKGKWRWDSTHSGMTARTIHSDWDHWL